MSDGIDPLATGGIGSGLGGVIVAFIMRGITGSGIDRLEKLLGSVDSKVDESHKELRERIDEQRHETKEQIATLKEMMAGFQERHDRTIAEVAVHGGKVAAAHQRLDMLERDVREMKSQLDGIGRRRGGR